MLLLMIQAACSGCSPTEPRAAVAIQQAKSALAKGQFVRAEQLAALVPSSDSEWVTARMIAGEAAARAGRNADAIQHYLELGASGSARNAAQGQFFAGEIYRDLGRLTDADAAYRAVLQHDPDNAAAHERRAFLKSVSGQPWEALAHYWFLVRSGTADVSELILLADLDRPLENRQFVEACARKAPDDHLVQLGLAAHDFWEGKSEAAERRLNSLLATDPHLIAGQAMLGELLLDRGDAEFTAWHRSLPEGGSSSPDIWCIRGMWARRKGELRIAVRCFWEAVRLAPTHRRATYQLGQVLAALGEASADSVARQSEELIQLTQAVDSVVRTQFQIESSYRRTAELLEQLGRVWEACAWALVAERRFADAAWPAQIYARLAAGLNDDLPLTVDSANLAVRYDLSQFPDHRQLLPAGTSEPGPGGARSRLVRGRPDSAPAVGSIRFIDESAEAGVDFVYFSGPDPSTSGVRMLEQTGGGVAVLDFDGDGRPDLYFSNGSEWEHGAEAPTPSDRHLDRMYRNLGASFTDVTLPSGLGDRSFGQGCSVGDIDNDGFPDLYVANIGRNRLFTNNGDGTFTDITERSGLQEISWTASCVVVDLNADGNPDLFDVTYLTGPEVYQRICEGRACSPNVFQGLPDRLHVSRGDGTFESMSIDAPTDHSKGLGLVAADLYDRGRPSLLIANDQVPNFLLRNYAADNRFNVRLQNDALHVGVAFNEDGLAMGSMGIAADDANGDGRLDFFMTTFSNESSTLYLQDADGLYVDATRASGLRAATWPFIGWGTQFLDADLDGEPDLVAVNGHVDEYDMRPQFFRNVGRGQFVELPADAAGPFFEKQYRGRGLARLDWNGDGRMDFVVSNIGQSAALVTNRSNRNGRFVNVRLHATATARDAIGSVVTVFASGRRWTKQLVAGDGYMASNERVLQFGLGPAEQVMELTVAWPSGLHSLVRDVPADVTVELLEGSSRGLLRRSPGSETENVPVSLVLPDGR
jgi:tetratricopeptide (TPR) repeat protein